ncbi:MAG: hypothetical protein COY49_11975 [Comamonadaceae bacterium CG_4_10_14_0_8_um_filter_57_29]|nr:MAG: hypothetical protein COY49_11975 [Comamonadaceae bacterium CG_4_10_14_0_8_um_filter_57_29]
MNFPSQASLMEPHHFSAPAPWAGHIPFGSWLVSVQRPSVFVELGAYSGISYLAFCQAIQEQGLATHAYAVDTWQGDAHTGAYNESIYQTLKQAHDPHYTEFSSLMRMTFDEALHNFADASVDLLHIDGLHTYEAVRHDFETWLPKLSGRAVVLFHDTHVFKDDFGVHQLWAEISGRYPSLQFTHSNGLGVLLVGTQQPAELLQLCSQHRNPQQRAEQDYATQLFAKLGSRFEQRAEVLILQNQLQDTQTSERQLLTSGEQRHQWIEKLDQQVLQLQRIHAHDMNAIEQLNGNVSQLEANVALLEARSRRDIQSLNASQALVQEIYASSSWRVTAWLRALGRMLRGLRAALSAKGIRRARNALCHLAGGHWRVLGQRLMAIQRDSQSTQRTSAVANARHIGIMATVHTLFVAHSLVKALEKAGYQTSVFTQAPSDGFVLDLYIVVCPQMFACLPPGEKRIAFQMEQSVSSRWFTPGYIQTLENSLAVLDYAPANLRYLQTQGITYPHTYLVPIGGMTHYAQHLSAHGEPTPEPDTPCDVLFYGDVNAPRRQSMLKELRKHFKVRTEGDLFGAALRRAVLSAKVVVNIHYYEGSLLESTRIFECLSLGVPLVSEASADMADHTGLQHAVQFVAVSDVPAMITAVQRLLTQAQPPSECVSKQAMTQAVSHSEQHFQFMLYRALYALRVLSHDEWQRLTEKIPLAGTKLALSMPETTQRRTAFEQVCPPGVKVFDGVRQHPGWVGCALSYRYLAQHALQAGLTRLEVMEDDVLFSPDYATRRPVVDDWLDQHEGQWHVFAGLIAQIHPDTQVLAVEEHQGLTFVTLDRMTSMVHNIYAKPTLQVLATWDHANTNANDNTIDRHLQLQPDLRVVVVLPFLVGHRDDMDSSLWGINNSHYNSMIVQSEADLQQAATQYRLKQTAKLVATELL